MKALWRYVLIALLPLGIGACDTVPMTKADQEPVIRPGESMVVFMRSSFYGGAFSASVYDVSGDDPQFIGIINMGTKIGYPVKPGKHTFMVVSEVADFMEASVAAGRTYYALVTPRIGISKARFSFRPVRQHELSGSEFTGWNSATHFVVKSPESESWAMSNAPDIQSKRNQYWVQWVNKPEPARAEQTLNLEDGRM